MCVFQVPANHAEWAVTEHGFHTRWNFPGCHGAIHGKHVLIPAPPQCGSEFWNYKGTNSTVLMVIVDHDYSFDTYMLEQMGGTRMGNFQEVSTI